MISILNLSMRFGGKVLFQNVNLQFNPGCHYGLIGANGSGKSTFIKILTGEVSPEKGDVNLPSQQTLGFLQQDHYLYEEDEILNVVLRGKTKLWSAFEKQKKLLEKEHFSEKECEELEKIEAIIIEQDGYTASSEAAKLLEGLGIKESWHKKPLKLLSGGYKLRTLLAKVLFAAPDVLILDEPTNHLDIFSIKWLENYLKNFPGMLVVTSHDRDFLNGICTHIADVDYGNIKIYPGNYDQFIQQKQQDKEQKEALLTKYDKKREDIQEFIDRFGAKATKAKQAQSKAKIVEKLVEEMESLDLCPTSRIFPNLKFTPYRSSGIICLKAKEISKSYGTKKVLHNVSFEIEKGNRLAIIGPNGIGKSTLLEILTGNKSSDEGSFEWGHATRVAYFPQDHTREVNGSESLLDWLGKWDSSLNQQQLREILGRVLFSGDTVDQSIKTLSGGETARLILAKMIMQKPNILIFDEPTNHLDMEAIEELSKALQNFEETVIFVSHNRYFLSKVANRILEITEEGVKAYPYTYPEYIEKLERDFLSTSPKMKDLQSIEFESKNKAHAKTSSLSYEEQKKQKNMKAQLKKKISLIEEECQLLESKLKQCDEKMAAGSFYEKTNREEHFALINEKESFESKLMKTMAEWETLSVELQNLE